MRARTGVLVLLSCLAVAASTPAHAGMNAPDVVVARADGTFEYDWSFVVDASFVTAGLGASDLANTSGLLHGDCFCAAQCAAAAGETIRWHVTGSLVDAASEGLARNWVSGCEGGGGTSLTRVVPFGTTAVYCPEDLLFRLWSAPNPSQGATRLYYVLPVQGRVTLRLYDLLGRGVATLVDGVEPAGARSVAWNAGASLRRGVYFARLSFAGRSKTIRVVLD